MKYENKFLRGNIVLIIIATMVLSTIPVMINAENVEKTIGFDDPIIDLRFYQMDFTFDDKTYENTDWGSVDLLFVGQEPILYFNLAVNGEWQIQNIPVLSIEGANVDQIMTYYFDLGNEVGEVVTDITYGYALTEDILLSMPPETDTAIVADGSQIMSPGFGGEMPDLANAEPLIGGLVFTDIKYVHKNFPNQDCEENECVPAAVSNSLKFLNKRHKLGLDDDDLDIDDMKDATDWDDGCDLFKWWEKKKKYMEDDDDYPFTTRKVTNMDQLIEEINSGQDVEITESWYINGKKTGHTSCLVGITKLENGQYKLDIAHDREQGVDGRTEITSLTYDPNTKKLSCNGRGRTTFEYAVVECPKLCYLDFHWNETGYKECSLKVYATHDCEKIEPALLDISAKYCRRYRIYVPKEYGDEDVNDLLCNYSWLDGCGYIKYATADYDDENEKWKLVNLGKWADENVEVKFKTYIMGDKNHEIQEIYVMVELDKFLENPVPPQDEYLVINGVCEDLPGYLIGTTPIVFNPNAGPDENPFSTTPIEYYVLSNFGDITIGPPENQAPYSPELSGPPSGKPGTSYAFTVVTTDPEDDNVYYYIDWGDSNTEWVGPYLSGEEVTVSHSWSKKGTYTIKAQSKDVYGDESEWSDTLTVTMPRARTINTPFLTHLLEKFPHMFPILRHILGLYQ